MKPGRPRGMRAGRWRARGSSAVVAALGGLAWSGPGAAGGLVLRIEGAGQVDQLVVSNVCLHVPAGGLASPFVPPGAFRAEWSGAIDAELRGDFRFLVLGSGTLKLEINGVPVFPPDTPLDENSDRWSGSVRLRKGPNLLKASLEGSSVRGAGARLFWQGRSIPPGPIPDTVLGASGEAGEGLEAMAAAGRGRAAFLDFRCGRCHASADGAAMPELTAEGPTFVGLGDRRNFAWLARWIEDPKSMRPEATMPRLVHGPGARVEARAIAAWLASLKGAAVVPEALRGHPGAGRALFGSLLCDACHASPEGPPQAGKVSLAGIAGKFVAPALAPFLRRPAEHYPRTPMPDFQLGETEAANLAAWLLSATPATIPAEVPSTDPATLERGRRLAEDRGCLACHAGPGTNRLAAPSLAQMTPKRWTRGCVGDAEAVGTPGRAPRYDFGTGTLGDFRALAARDRESVTRRVPSDSAGRWLERLRCAGCHEGREGIPRIESIGEKLRPEWMTRLLSGKESPKARPWLQARMPAFPAYADELAEGLANIRGRSAVSPPAPAPDVAAAAVGRRMVSASGGFSCVTCHAVGSASATAVFEAPGVNFARVSSRLLPDYFARWVRNPQAIEPGTKMPLYFDEEGNSALTDYFGGDGPKTIHALWEYLRQGERIVPPEP